MNILLKQPPAADDADNPIRIAWGAAAPARSWREFEARFGVGIREGYGISEAQNFTHLNLDGRVGSIGKPVEEFTSWIADDNGKPVPPRVVGEIVVKPTAPDVTMVGYFRDPQRTSEVLRDGCVYTGDLGCMDRTASYTTRGARRTRSPRGENVSAWESNGSSTPIRGRGTAVVGSSGDGRAEIRVFVQPHPASSNRSSDKSASATSPTTNRASSTRPEFSVADQRIRKSDLPRSCCPLGISRNRVQGPT